LSSPTWVPVLGPKWALWVATHKDPGPKKV